MGQGPAGDDSGPGGGAALSAPEDLTVWTVGQVAEATGGRLIWGDPSAAIRGISTDSRALLTGQAFVALAGPRFNAQAFVHDVAARGAACLVVAEPPEPQPPVPTILVQDTTRALGALGAYHRRRFPVPVVAVTGSCGKTTTKELLAHLLAGTHRVLKTTGTQNNQIGLPHTLLRLTADHEIAVVELGSNHPGEIAYLANLAAPTMALITNIGPAHLEFFGTLDGVLQEKLSLVQRLGAGDTAIVPGDQLDVVLQARERLHPLATLVTYGTTDQCNIQAVDIAKRPDGWSFRLRDAYEDVFVPLPGSHNVENALAAVACGLALGFGVEDLAARLRTFHTLPMRSELIRADGVTILNDCYNANPLSFARALEILKDLDVARKIVIAGDMLELGQYATAAHRAIGRMIAELPADQLLAVGRFAADMAQGASERPGLPVQTFRTVEELLPQVRALVQRGDGLLIKGSRNIKLEQVVTALSPHSHARASQQGYDRPAA